MQTGYYSIRWEIYKSGYDSAFALVFDPDGTGATLTMIPGSNYGAMSHDEKFSGQTIAFLTAGGVVSLNRIDNLYTLTILNEIGGGTLVTGASIVIIKIA